jgi:hypothetical protein
MHRTLGRRAARAPKLSFEHRLTPPVVLSFTRLEGSGPPSVSRYQDPLPLAPSTVTVTMVIRLRAGCSSSNSGRSSIVAWHRASLGVWRPPLKGGAEPPQGLPGPVAPVEPSPHWIDRLTTDPLDRPANLRLIWLARLMLPAHPAPVSSVRTSVNFDLAVSGGCW